MNLAGALISVVVQNDEAVIQQEPRIALLSVAVINLIPSLDILHRLNDKPALFIGVGPGGLLGPSMIQHV